jgi:hypothetical protein
MLGIGFESPVVIGRISLGSQPAVGTDLGSSASVGTDNGAVATHRNQGRSLERDQSHALGGGDRAAGSWGAGVAMHEDAPPRKA